MGFYAGPISMPVTRYLNVELSQWTYPYDLDNIELADALQELRAVTQKDWVILAKIKFERRFLRSPINKTKYELFAKVDDGEYQQINFYNPSNKSPFPQPVDDTVVMAYMIGYLAGRG